MFRKLCIAISLLLTASLSSAAAVEATVQQPVMVGETSVLRLSIEGDDSPKIERLPKVEGLAWGQILGTSSRIEIVNMKRRSSVEMSLGFTVKKEGDYVIPPIQLKSGKMKIATEPVSFSAVARTFNSGAGQGAASGKAVSADETLFAKISPVSSKGKFYVGEEIPFEVRVYRLVGVEGQLSWPDLSSEQNIVFKDFSAKNPDNPKFDRFRQGREAIGGRTYDVFRFDTAIRALSPGKLSLKGTIKATLATEDARRRSPFDDDFFFGSTLSRGRGVERNLSLETDSLEILPLPPPPPEVSFLGLAGDWKVACSLDSSEAHVGDTLSLRVKLQGSGSLETLKAPQFDIQGFRVYPPEIEKSKNGADIRYVLIPTAAGEAELHISVATFDTDLGQYKTVPFYARVKVLPAQAISGGQSQAGQVVVGAQSASSDSVRSESQEPAKKRANGVLYLKKTVNSGVALPLWRNAVVPSAIFLGLGFLAFAVMFAMHDRRRALAADPRLARREAASSSRRSVLRALEDAEPQKLPDAVSSKLLPYLCDMLDAAPGAGASELADKLRRKSPELAECLDKVSSAAWSPDAKAIFDAAFKSRLLKALGKLSLLLALVAAPLYGAEPLKTVPANLDAAMTAYDSGDFKGASLFFRSKLNPSTPSPATLYNLGNCLYHLGELPQALLCYERALRLAPRDSDILENLNLTRRKLDLPEVYKLETPADVIPCFRDFLRPDEWFVLFSAGIGLALAALGLRLLRRESPVWLGLLAAGLAVAVLSGVCALTQQGTSYSQDWAMALVRGASVHSLPSESSQTLDMALRPGEFVNVAERRGDWIRIRQGEAEGWLKASDASPVWRSAPAE